MCSQWEMTIRSFITTAAFGVPRAAEQPGFHSSACGEVRRTTCSRGEGMAPSVTIVRSLSRGLFAAGLLAVLVGCGSDSEAPLPDPFWQVQQDGRNYYGVWGSSGRDVFAVGDNGTIRHYDGNTWSLQTSGTNSTLEGVWGSSSSDVFAVGWSSTVLHYNGSAWTVQTSG